MATQYDDGGPAFPEAGLSGLPNGEFIHGQSGMTLRDWFAGQILASGTIVAGESDTVASAEAELGLEKGTYTWKVHWPVLRAKRAYQAADAMLAARKKPA
jgi:hypothetical protein